MSVIWAEGFEHYGTGATSLTNMIKGLWSSAGGTGTNGVESTSTPRTGTYYYRIATNSSSIRRAFGSRNTVGIAFGIRFPSLPSDNGAEFSLRNDSNTRLITFVWNTDGSILIYDGSHVGTLIDTTEQVITAGTWHHVEIIATVSETVGAIEVRVDGVPVSILADLDLGSVNMAQCNWENRANSGVITHVDDIVAHTGDDFIGPARVLTVYPEADVSPFGDWTITGAASGAEAVDEIVPDGDTSYITALFEDDACQFTMPELPVDVTELVGIYIPFMARQNDAGLTRIMTSLISDAEIVDGTEHSLTPAYVYFDDAFSQDPAVTDVWTKASFEAAILQMTRTI